MHKLRTLNLPSHRGRDFFVTIFVEPDPNEFDSFEITTDADEWGMSIHFQPDNPYASQVEVARVDTTHGEPHFDRLYEPDQPKDWLGQSYTYEQARRDFLTNWRDYAERTFKIITRANDDTIPFHRRNEALYQEWLCNMRLPSPRVSVTI